MASPKPLLDLAAAATPPTNHHRRGAGFPWDYPELGFIAVAFNYGACLYRGGGDCGAHAYFFVVGLGVLLLLFLIRLSLRAPPGSAARARLKFSVWVVDTAVIAAATWWFTNCATEPPMPLRFAAPLWAVAVAASAFLLPMCLRRD